MNFDGKKDMRRILKLKLISMLNLFNTNIEIQRNFKLSIVIVVKHWSRGGRLEGSPVATSITTLVVVIFV